MYQLEPMCSTLKRSERVLWVYFSTRYNESARSDTIDEPLGSAAVRCNEKDKKEKVSFAILGQLCNLLLMTRSKLLRG